MKALAQLGSCLLLVVMAQAAPAQRAVLDDSPSPRQTYSLDLGWQPHEIRQSLQALLNDQNADVPPLTGIVPGVDIRLDTRRYVGQPVRIFLRLPTAMPGTNSLGDIELSWQPGGPFQGGSVSPGQEALLFEGMIDQPVTGGVLNFILSIGPGGAPDRFNVEPVYEVEIIT